MQRWLATAAPGQIGGVTVNAAAALRAVKTRREGVARQIITAELSIPLTTGAGRPSADLLLKREQLAALVTAYGVGDGPWDEWWPNEAIAVFEARKWEWFKKEEGGGAVGEGDGDGIDDDAAGKSHSLASPAMMIICRAKFHLWASDGTHAGWLSVKDWRAWVLEHLHHTVSRAQAYRYWELEREYHSTKHRLAIKGKLDFVQLINDIASEKAEIKAMLPEVEPASLSQHIFQPAWHDTADGLASDDFRLTSFNSKKPLKP